MKEASKKYNWNLNFGNIASIWRNGCIIRSIFLNKVKEAFDKNPELPNLMLDPFFIEIVNKNQLGLRKIINIASSFGVPIPAISSALSYYDWYRTANLPANLIQAQRDYFGAHTYKRIDRVENDYFHTEWTCNSDKE